MEVWVNSYCFWVLIRFKLILISEEFDFVRVYINLFYILGNFKNDILSSSFGRGDDRIYENYGDKNGRETGEVII